MFITYIITFNTFQGASAAGTDWLQALGFSDQYLLNERALGLQKDRALHAMPDNWMQNLAVEGSTMVHEKRGLPAGTERVVYQGYEEVSSVAFVLFICLFVCLYCVFFFYILYCVSCERRVVSYKLSHLIIYILFNYSQIPLHHR